MVPSADNAFDRSREQATEGAYLCRVDEASGVIERVAFCAGFLRGLSFWRHFALVAASLPREPFQATASLKSFGEAVDALNKRRGPSP